ncbi:MAG TPA: ParA family protein [Turneriella sp.]|nr:ParA family protein [Turneriella sp.]HNL10580.1 ParA family protein [Turneriella sp.]HNL54901.1 ParA family protein [Turneriella sp.]
MSTVLSITNQKGGVAKTTTALALAHAFARRDEKRRVLLIDLDSQRNATSILLGGQDIPPERSVYALFQAKKPESSILYNTSLANLFVIPSNLHLVEVESQLTGALDGFFRLNDAMQKLRHEFDFILLDCPPSLSVITINAMVAADFLLIPLQISKFSIDGIQNIRDAVNTVNRRYNAHLKIAGGCLTLHDGRTTLSQAMLPEVEKILPILQTTVPRSVAVEEAHLLRQDIHDYAPQNKVAVAYAALAEELEAVFAREQGGVS